jgi:RNA polymerase sigma-70 factor (sigma-E family)
VTSAEDEFVAFAETASPRLRRTAFLLCGDWHTAEDLAQTALAKVFVAWRRISRKDAVLAYAQRTLLNTYLADRRVHRPPEVLTSRLPERAARSPEPEQRLAVLDALATLAPRARAVVVLRYWADMSVEQVAELLGCSAGNVKSQSARALDRLRPLLSDAGHPASSSGPRPARSQSETRQDNRSITDG